MRALCELAIACLLHLPSKQIIRHFSLASCIKNRNSEVECMDAVWSRLGVYMGGLMNRYRQVSVRHSRRVRYSCEERSARCV